MNSFNVIAGIDNTFFHGNFIATLLGRYPDTGIFYDIDAFEKHVSVNSISHILVFLDSSFIDKISDRTKQTFMQENYTIIILFSETADNFFREGFIYDIFEYKSDYATENFLTRLNDDVNSKIQLSTLKAEMKNFYDIGKYLSSEKDIRKLLEIVIDACMEMTDADAATIYTIVEENSTDWSVYESNSQKKNLKFVIAKNNSVKLNLEANTFPILKDSISGFVIITGEPLRIDNAYEIPPESEFKFSTRFDEITGYKTESILTVPMKDSQNRVLGIVQLINKKSSGKIIPFTSKDEMIIFSFAGQAAVAVENNLLNKKNENLLHQYKLMVYEEIEKRKAADEEICRLLSAVEHSPVAVIITDVNGNIQYVNPKFTELTGYSSKEILDKNIRIINSGEHTQEFYGLFWKTLQSGVDWHGEFHNRKKNGEFYWESTYISSMKDENNNIKYFIGVREDITEKKMVSEKLERKNIELHNTIRKLNEAQSQLIQKEKMAGIGQLAAGVAHEINNPLGFVMSNYNSLKNYIGKLKGLFLLYKDYFRNVDVTSLVQKQIWENIQHYEDKNQIDFILSDLEELLSDSSDGLGRVKDIVSALKSFSNINQLDEFSEYDLNSGIKTTLVIANSQIKSDILIERNLREIPLLYVMGGEINQVILNLILNAAYAIIVKEDKSKGVIKISTFIQEQNVCCSIEDNGVGIQKEDVSRIFEPFFTTKPIGEGTGLGLSISYDIIVKKHNGEFLVESAPHKGTKFTFKLPITKSASNKNHASFL